MSSKEEEIERLRVADEVAAKVNLGRIGYPVCHDFNDYGCRECGRCYFCDHKVIDGYAAWLCPSGKRHKAALVVIPDAPAPPAGWIREIRRS